MASHDFTMESHYLTLGYFILILIILAITSLEICIYIKRLSKRWQISIKIVLIIIITTVIAIYLHEWQSIVKFIVMN